MVSYRQEIVQSWVRSEASSRSLATLLGLDLPVTLRDIVWKLRQVETLNLHADINTDDDAPINGRVHLDLKSNGDFNFWGDVRATGFTSYAFAVQVWAGSPDGAVLFAQEIGKIFGTDTPGDSVKPWNEPGTNLALIDSWRALRAAPSLTVNFDYHLSGVLGGALDVLEFAAKGAVANLVLGPYGWYVMLGNELLGLDTELASPDILAGIAVAGGVLLLLGPVGILPAIVAGVATAAIIDIKHRTLHDWEKDWAYRIFGDKIRYDDIVVTNMLGTDGNKLTWPMVGDKILMGLGPAWDTPTTWADPDPGSDYTQPGAVFAHEMTHAWQITQKSLIRVICDISKTYDYSTGDANWDSRGWHSFTAEQQAHIVDDWYGRNYLQLDSPQAFKDKAYHYIRDNILKGIT